MPVFLGNLLTDDIENRLGIKFSVDDRNNLIKTHNPNAEKIAMGKWHCFDIPFMFVTRDKNTLINFARMFKTYEKDMKGTISFSCQEATKDEIIEIMRKVYQN